MRKPIDTLNDAFAEGHLTREELATRLADAVSRHDVTVGVGEGHAGDPGNERADALARQPTHWGSRPARFAERTEARPVRARRLPGERRVRHRSRPGTEDQPPFPEAMFFGSWLADAVAEQVRVCHPGAVVVGYLPRSAVSEAGAHRIPLIMLMHTAYRFMPARRQSPGRRWDGRVTSPQ